MILKLSALSDPDTKNKILSSGVMAGGGLVIRDALHSGDLTGRTTLYHGTTKRDAEKILSGQGIQGSKTGRVDGVTKQVLNGDVLERSKGKAFMTKKKWQARNYAFQAHHIRDLGKDIHTASPLNAVKTLIGMHGGKVIKGSVPLWKMKSVRNPELDAIPKALTSNAYAATGLPFSPFDQAHKIYSKDTVTIEGTISSKYLKGSKNYKRLGLSEFKEYVKTRPKQFAKGVAKSVAGLAAIGAGVYSLNKLRKKVD